jgi:hypothetical protein
MTAEIKLECGTIIIDNGGNFSIEGRIKKNTPCYYLKKCWDYIYQYMKDYRSNYDWEKFLKEVREGYEYWPPSYGRFSSYGSHPEHRFFGINDLLEVLADSLKYYVANEDVMQAVAIALAIKKMPFEKWEDEPQISVESYETGFADGTGVMRYETHKLMIQDVEISEWEEQTARRTCDSMYFTTETEDYRKDHGFDELGPSEIDLEVLEALGVKEEDPDFPDEEDMGLPEIDESGKGVFGLLYHRTYETDPRFKFEIVVYNNEMIVKDAYNLAQYIESNAGGDYEITKVRRLAPSELAFITPIEDQPKGPVNDWTELESWQYRPDDFDG